MHVYTTTTTNQEAVPAQTWKPWDGFSMPQWQPCLIEEFFKAQQARPPGARSGCCMIACPCPRCTPWC